MKRAFLLCPIFLSAALAQTYRIETYAGGAPPPTPAPGTAIAIGLPLGIASDSAGNAYFASLNCVFKVDSNGIVTRIAGNSRAGYSGDGGPATSAELANPSGVAVDAAGAVYVADGGNYRVRKIYPDGLIDTVAGNGAPGATGDGGKAKEASLSYVTGLALDAAGNLFIAQSYYFVDNVFAGGNRVRKVSPDGIITTVAGNDAFGFSGDNGPAVNAALSQPTGIAIDAEGNLFIADYNNNRVRKVSPEGVITTVVANGSSGFHCVADSSGDGGPVSRAHFCAPSSVAVDRSGNLYIGEFGFDDDPTDDRVRLNFLVRKVSPDGTMGTVAGNGSSGFSGDGGPARAAELYGGPVAIDQTGEVLMADYARIRRVSTAGIIGTIAGNGAVLFSGDGGAATGAMLDRPTAVATDRAGNVFLIDSPFYSRIRKISADGTITTVAGNGSQAFSGDGGPATAAGLFQPEGLAADRAGNLFIADTYSNRVRKVSPEGIITTVAGTGGGSSNVDSGRAVETPVSPSALAVDGSGNVFLVDGLRIRELTPDGVIRTVVPAADLERPTGLAVDVAGNLFIADRTRVRRLAPDGGLITVAGNGAGGFSGDHGPALAASLDAFGVTVDDSGNLFIVGGDRIRMVAPDGIITTIAGNGAPGYTGDGGPAVRAQLWAPRVIAADPSGNIYVADTGNSVVRVLRPAVPHYPRKYR